MPSDLTRLRASIFGRRGDLRRDESAPQAIQQPFHGGLSIFPAYAHAHARLPSRSAAKAGDHPRLTFYDFRMNAQPTPEQYEDFECALKIGTILASAVGTTNSLRIRVNPQTLNEAARIYSVLGAKMPYLQEMEQFVTNCLLHNAETFAVCSHRIILCQYLIGHDVVYWYGNGKVKEQGPLDDVIFFVGDNSLMIASILLEQALFLRLQPFLTPQPSISS